MPINRIGRGVGMTIDLMEGVMGVGPDEDFSLGSATSLLHASWAPQ